MEDELNEDGLSEDFRNPYDFRRPVTDAELLAGRERELERVERCLESTAHGHPIHIALIGERAAGKTSLLNIAAGTAKDRGLLVVKIALDESVVSTPFTFFSALFEKAMGALSEAGVFDGNATPIEAWRRQVYMGDVDVSTTEQTLLFGAIAAGQLHGTNHEDISPFVIEHDFQEIARLAASTGIKAILLLLDEGDLLGTRAAIFQKLRNVLQDSASWMLIAAGTRAMFSTMSDVFSPMPRQLERINVVGLNDRLAVLSCMRKPIRKDWQIAIPPNVVDDVTAITHGRPYEINLVSYFMWEEMRESGTGRRRFRLTQKVLDNVLEELRGVSMDASIKEVDRLRKLDSLTFEDLADLVPYQQMTVRQAAMSALIPQDYEAEQLERTEVSLNRQIDGLIDAGVVQREGDRFRVLGDEFVQIYLKFALARHSKDHAHFPGYGGRSFAQAVADTFVSEALSASDGVVTSTQTLRKSSGSELGNSRAESLGLRFCQELKRRDVPAINRSTPFIGFVVLAAKSDAEGTAVPDASGERHIGVGFSFQIGLEMVDVLVLVGTSSRDAIDLELELLAWKDANASLLTKYETQVLEIVAEDIPCDLLKDISNYAEARQGLFQQPMFEEFASENYQKACEIVRGAVEVLELYLGEYVGTNRYRPDQIALADASNRLGFLALLSGEPEDAKTALERSLAIDDKERTIRLFNMGRCQFELGEWQEAALCFTSASSHWRMQVDTCFLMAAIDLPDDLRTPAALVTTIQPEWVQTFCDVHALIAQGRSTEDSVAYLKTVIEQRFMDEAIPTVFSRILAWEHYRAGDLEATLDILRCAEEVEPTDQRITIETNYLEEVKGRE